MLDLRAFWIKCLSLVCGLFVLTCVVSATQMARFHSQRFNQTRLDEMKQQSQNMRQQFEEDIRYLVSDLIYLQTDKKHSKNFIVHGVLNKKNKEVVQVYPQKLKKQFDQTSQFSQFSLKSLKHFPITFHSINFDSSQSQQVALVVDLDQVKNVHLPESLVSSGILFGIVSHKKMKEISRAIIKGGFSEAFIFDANKGWSPLHSNVNYSGQILPQTSFFHQMVQNHKYGWTQDVSAEETLTTGLKLTLSDHYLILSRKKILWSNYFTSSLKEVFPLILGLYSIFFIFLTLFIQPIVKAFEHLALTLRIYALSKKFPIPRSNKNPYVMQTLPWMKKIYWDLRAHQMVEITSQEEPIKLFSQMIKKQAQNIEDQYPNIKINLRLIEDASVATQKTWLKEVFSEILKNAVECVNQNGFIDICTLRKDHLFCCTVRDYGKGIQKEVDQVCQAYDSSKKDDMGLGLALAESALSKLGGSIQFLNKNPGLEVEVTLPLDKVKVPQTRIQI